ncbi:spermidine synthase [Nitrosococcus oceani ATCC 19707]|uniref:Polyamine aminopropyltransferase n=2 Tax=Nitrosococcus oceani TaxID=1229 RepID=SPEE_NITOC|nr:polyamine aminopropyltransferase [Nitrosococcus oceani]Q3JDL8.1 RecName: Full=Polyamine aminopropyltransferase; AltName: Full=Putrescine aminopropyltransferase; Short=PAPT; AltName: Full=Spermidine synthase; Short=SPDS; Short=SPDSY [Nitrosococcus oceani ATCC 19707]KFI20486.1 spermidine synthase [Nitrosococcus oceani C-27]ABA57078.1 spermidine synthase [Nitrosococcus oceani ATCC 19707]EDZ66259.1 spermidine synthase [Nitrosococcus oceani AFC27]GEM19907.1 polyamine aminopropyltransferase [Nitr
MQLDPKGWFTEVCKEGGLAFSLAIREKLHAETTPYQYIEIYQTETFGRLMVIDGFIMLSGRDNFFYHEMMAHPVLFTHPHPQRVLIIGGGDCGTLREVLKHDVVEKVQQVEIDERVTRLAEKYFPELCQSNDDPRAHFHFGDGLRFVAEAPANSVDVIIIDSTDPIGSAEGLFQASFYADCQRLLGEKGILVHQSESPLIHLDLLNKMRAEMKKGGFPQVRTLTYPQCVYPSGWWSATLAGHTLSCFRERDATAKIFPTRYYNVDIHRASLAVPEFLRQTEESS